MAEIEFQNKKIFYQVAGSGPTVFLIHGFGENGNVFAPQVSFLKDHYRLIVPDLPGSGQSEPLEGSPSLADFADIIFRIAQKECGDKEKYSVFGHSMGGYTTMAFAEKYMENLAAFGLLHSSAYADTDDKKESRKKSIGFIRSNGGKAFLKTITPDLFSDSSKKSHPGYIQRLLDLADGMADETLIQYYHAMINRPDRSAVLKQSTIPVLFMIGKHDKVVPLEAALKQSQLPAIASVNILDDSAHMGMWEEEEKFNRKFKEFLQNFI